MGIREEVAEDAKAYLRHRQFAIQMATGNWMAELKAECDSPEPAVRFSQSLHTSLVRSDSLGYVSNHQAEWIRWWRWSGMLGIASRSFSAAESALKTALRYADERIGGYPPPPGEFGINRPQSWKFVVSN